MKEKIVIKGAKVHNLKNINAELPKNKIITISGVSGSGKSSLAFDTIFAEGQRRYIESLSPYARQFLGQMDKPDVEEIFGLSPAIAIDQKALSRNPRSIVGTLTEVYDYMRVLFARIGKVYCPKCGTKIEKLSVDEMVNIIIKRAYKNKIKFVSVLSPVIKSRKGEYYQLFYDFLSLGYHEAYIDSKKYSMHEPIKLSRYKKHNIDIVVDRTEIDDKVRLTEAIENALDYSSGLVKIIFNENEKKQKEFLLSSLWTCPKDNFSFPEIEPRLFSFNSPMGACPKCFGLGTIDFFRKEVCPICKGKRLKKEALSVKITNKNIYEISQMTIEESYDFFVNLESKLNSRDKTIAGNLISEIINRLAFMLEVGLDYLTLDRKAETLSGGEAQRIRLASQIGSQLSNTLYVLDEPTIGLHSRDTEKLIKTLKSLQKLNNTVIIVEHDESVVTSSDYLLDLGPFAGELGGEIVAQGKIDQLLKNPEKFPNSLTLKYLSGKEKIEIPKRRIKLSEKLKIVGANANNLKNIQIEIPLRKLVCFAGVSGSGKSSLMNDCIYKNLENIKLKKQKPLINITKVSGNEYLNRIIKVDQSPIGRSPRSNPATYTGIFTPIREFFAMLPKSREKGFSMSRFSFNRSGGRCEACEGRGFNEIEMHFLPPVFVKCEVCQGKRYSKETLSVKYKGKNIADVLELSVEEALKFFNNHYQIFEKLKVLKEVGLGYLRLGQSATTLSGGEAQRIKLARELTSPLGQKTLYLLDEPTVGLHYHDVKLLIKVLNKLINKGNSIIVIEHNLHLIKSADYVFDLGPEGGEKGGRIIAKGTPEEIAKNEKSYTGQYLKYYL